MSPIIVIKFKEVKALKKNNNESVNAIIDLIVVREAYLLKSSLVLRMISYTYIYDSTIYLAYLPYFCIQYFVGDKGFNIEEFLSNSPS